MIPQHIKKSEIPRRSGIYIYKDLKGDVLYVGKAIDLFSRVSSYFNERAISQKTASLVEKIVSIETIVVESELEALLLEANYIKKILPPYNIRLTDDKDYLYVKITKAPYPKVIISRKKELSDAKIYFGPFPSSKVVKNTLKKLRRIFPWCNNPPQVVGSVTKSSSRACFYYHLRLCSGACVGKVTRDEYNKTINHFSKFMQGKKQDLVESLKKEMEGYSRLQKFEEAQRVKKMIDGLEYILQTNNTAHYLENPNFMELQNQRSLEQLKVDLNLVNLPSRIECFDISNIGGKNAVGSLVVLTDGDIDKKWYRRFKIRMENTPNDFGMMAEVIERRVKHDEWPKPDLILIDGGRGQVSSAKGKLDLAGWEDVPTFGLAKRMEWLYPIEGEVIKLSKNSLSLRVLQKIRDEAHRFALAYHRKLRNESQFKTP